MVTIQSLDGQVINVNENDVILVAGPFPHDVGPHTYVYLGASAALVTSEDAQALVTRLGVKQALAVLTRPNNTPVWINGQAVSLVRQPLPIEIQGSGEVNAVVQVGQYKQAVRESVPTARLIIDELTLPSAGNVRLIS
jgi:hypothetical protein